MIMPLIATADRMLARFGGPGVLHTQGGWDGTGANAVEVPRARCALHGLLDAWDQSQVDSTAIQGGDVRAILSAHNLPVLPNVGDRLTFAGTTYRLVRRLSGWPRRHRADPHP